jgi:RecJ-like exonuclease
MRLATFELECPSCHGSGTLERLDVDLYRACLECHATGTIEAAAEACDVCGHIFGHPLERCQCQSDPLIPAKFAEAA